jgi:hypothetical protein
LLLVALNIAHCSFSGTLNDIIECACPELEGFWGESCIYAKTLNLAEQEYSLSSSAVYSYSVVFSEVKVDATV